MKTFITTFLILFVCLQGHSQLLKHFRPDAYVTRTTFHSRDSLRVERPGSSDVYLASLDGSQYERFAIHDQNPGADGQDAFRILFAVSGKAVNEPEYVIYAEWAIEDTSKEDAFVKSRMELFNLRGEHLSNFSFDVLLKHATQPGRYLIIGFYQDEAGLTDARSHPAIREWAKDNAPSVFSARDMYVPPVRKLMKE